MQNSRSRRALLGVAAAATLSLAPLAASAGGDRDGGHHDHGHKGEVFNRIAAFPVFNNTGVDKQTVAEIVAASKDGKTLIYTDSPQEGVGFVDITDPANPTAAGFVKLNGEPTSVAVRGDYALVAVNTSADFVNTAGELAVVNVATHAVVATIPMGGQPDSVAVSKDGKYAAVVIENERDEDLGNGAPPQAPAGFLVIVDLQGAPTDWTTRTVSFDGIADLYPDDAEPEYVDINDRNIAVVTLQENNHLILVDLKRGVIVDDFSAGAADLKKIDTVEEDPALISLTGSLDGVLREPDGVTWLSDSTFATADEGDLNGGSRGFTIYDKWGRVKFMAGNDLEHLAVRVGHYPDSRSENKCNEPENVKYAKYGKTGYLFVGSERSSVVFVYEIDRNGKPVYKQTLPAGIGPEGLLAIPSRGLFVAASEEDDRGDKVRSVVSIYRLENCEAKYPTIQSADRRDHTPIPWAALSGLAVDGKGYAYTLHDSYYQQARIFAMKLAKSGPATITQEILLRDSNAALTAVAPSLVNSDGTVNIDGEGISLRKNGGFWIASEGDGSASIPNMLLKVSSTGVILEVVRLPASVEARRTSNGFEGVAEAGQYVFVAFQREWKNDPSKHVRIGRYDTSNGEWKFFYYPINAATSPNGGWVGLSGIDYLGDGEFIVIERDNQAGPDSTIKKLYTFSVAGLTPLSDDQAPSFPTVTKHEVRDLIPDFAATGGLVLEKVEGVAVDRWGMVYVVNDNDGVDGSNGETQLMRFRLGSATASR